MEENKYSGINITDEYVYLSLKKDKGRDFADRWKELRLIELKRIGKVWSE